MQVWHAAVVLLDRLTQAGYGGQDNALLAAACVAVAAQKEGVPLDSAALAAALDAQVGWLLESGFVSALCV